MPKRPVLTLLVILGLGALFAAPLASAKPGKGKERIKSTVSIEFDIDADPAPAFAGNVRSKVSRCEKGRKVTVYEREMGGRSVVGTDTTDAMGAYSVGAWPTGTEYYAVVKPKAGSNSVCKGDRSPDLQFMIQ